MKHTFIYTDEKSSKFWTIEIAGNTYIVNYGKVGTTGQTQTKEFADEAACRKAVDKLIAEKTKKGYIESAQESEHAAIVSKSESLPEKETKKEAAVMQIIAFTYDDVEFYANEEEVLKRGAELVEKDSFTKRQMSADETVLLSDCKGSKSSVYECYIDMADPVVPKGRCNCPSRKKPCKHIIGLLLSKLAGQPFEISPELVSTVKPVAPQKADPKKKKVETSISNLEPLADDGKPKVWQNDEKLWDYYAPDYEEFEIERLENASEDDNDAQVEMGLERSDGNGMRKYDEIVELYRKKNVSDLLGIACQRADIDNMEYLWDLLITDEYFKGKNGIHKLESIYRDYMGCPNPDDDSKISTIEWLLKKGIDYTPRNFGMRELATFFNEEYKKDPRPERTEEILDMYVEYKFKNAKEPLIELFNKYIEALRKGKTEEEGIKYLPEGGFKEDCYGFSIWYSLGDIRLRALQTEIKNIFEIEADDTQDCAEFFGSWFIKKHIVPVFEKMIAEGKLDGLFPLGIFVLINDDTRELLFKHVFDDRAFDRFESYVKGFETGELHESRLTLECIFNTIRYETIQEADEERAFALLHRYLYSGNKDAESGVLYILERLTPEFGEKDPRALYELALWHKTNLRLDDARQFMHESIAHGSEHGKKMELILRKDDATRKILHPPMQRRDSAEMGFNFYVARQKWAGTFEAGFTEEDLFVKTENIIARARECGDIYIRFLIEGEQGYSEALDFVNNLLGKGYAGLSKGWTDGFSLNVYFVRKPEFIPQLKNARFDVPKQLYPRSSCHAFFARAVQYPALREKVVGYVERAMIEDHYYLDLIGGSSTVPGTFAVAALAFCGSEYFYLVENYACSIDFDHTYIHECLGRALVKYYGDDISTATVLYELAASVQRISLCPFSSVKNFIWSVPFFNAILEHIKDRSPQGLTKFYSCAMMLFEWSIKRNLTQFRSMWRAATDPEEKRIIAEFNNLYLSAMMLYKSKECEGWKPLLTTTVSVAEPKEDITLEEELVEVDIEDQSSVITMDEAKIRELKIQREHESKIMIFFSPACITNIEDITYAKSQRIDIGTENIYEDERRCYIQLAYNFGVECFGNWVIDGEKFEYEYGIIFYDGKNKPVVLFGQFDCLAMGIEYTNLKISTTEDYLNLRDKYLLKESPVARTDKEFIVANNFIVDHVGFYYHAWTQYHGALEVKKIAPQPYPLAYLSARVMLAHFAEMQVKFADMLKYYTELKELQPEKSDYWQKKIDFAEKLRVMSF